MNTVWILVFLHFGANSITPGPEFHTKELCNNAVKVMLKVAQSESKNKNNFDHDYRTGFKKLVCVPIEK